MLSNAVRHLFLSLLAALFVLPVTAMAQNGGFAGNSFRMGYSARGMAMANAMNAVTSEGSFAYYNPAQAALFNKNKGTDLTVGALQFDRVFQSTGIQLQLPPDAGLSFYLLKSGVKDIDGRTQSGYPTEYFNISEYQFASNFGIRLNSKLHAGVGVKFGLANYHDDLDQGVSLGVDIGILYQTNGPLNIGLSVKDLFGSYSWNSQQLYGLDQSKNVVNEFPTRYILGLAFQKEKFTLSGDFEIQSYTSEISSSEVFISDGSPVVITSNEQVETSSAQMRLGGSWKAHERFSLRAGWQLPDFKDPDSWAMSSGISIHLPFDIFSPSIDYAFVMEPYRISNMHLFSLRLNL